MKVRELFEYVDEIMESQFTDDVKRVWLNQIEAEIQVDVLLLAPDGITQYDETLYEAETIAPPPFDQLYQEYLFWRICLAQQDFELADGYAATFNRIYNEYVRFVCSTINPGDGMAERVQYYLTAYQIAVKHGYTGTELEWLASLKGDKGDTGAGLRVLGLKSTVEELPDDAELGDGYGVGTVDDNLLYVKTETGWQNMGRLKGKDGVSVTVASVSESTEDGGTNVVSFSDGKELKVKNGGTGKQGLTGLNIWAYFNAWIGDTEPDWSEYDEEIVENKESFEYNWLPEGYTVKVGDLVIVDGDPLYQVTADDGTAITMTKTDVSFRGYTGKNGRGIVSIDRTSGDGSPGTTDIYTITYDDESTDEFSVYNGADGPTGVGIRSVAANADGTWTITYTNGTTAKVTNAALTNAISDAKNAASLARDTANTANSAASFAETEAYNAQHAAGNANSAATTATEASKIANRAAESAGSAASQARSAASAADKAVTDLNDAKNGKVDKSGWRPNKYLGTDSNGAVVEKNAPEGTGGSGEPGEDGGYYTPAVTQPDANTMRVSYTASKSGMDAVESKDITLPAGAPGYTPQKGIDYFDGEDGTSVTVSSVSESTASGGTNVVTFSDGKQLNVKNGKDGGKGDKGDTGATGSAGATGQRGTGILKTTSAPSSYTTAIGDYTPKYRIALSTLKSQSKVNEVLLGDVIQNSFYLYLIDYLDSSYAYISVTRSSIRGAAGAAGADGATGPQGPAGSDATVTAENIEAALGYEPLDPDEMFTTRQETTPDYTNQIPISVDENGDIFGCVGDSTLNSSGVVTSGNGWVSGFIPIKKGDIIRVVDPSKTTFNTSVMFAVYGASKVTTAGIGKTVANIIGDASGNLGSLTVNGNVVTWDTSSISYYYWRDVSWLRVTTLSKDAIVTVNEPLTESVKEQLILKPIIKVTEESLMFDPANKLLSGKTVVGFGDSIFGYVRDASSVLSYMAEQTGATVYNVGFGGCRMSVHPTSGYAEFSMWALAKAITENNWTSQDAAASLKQAYFPDQLALLKTIDFDQVDIVVIHYGSNDFTAGNPGVAIDNANDRDDYTTMCGALRYSIEKLLGAYPHLQIFIDLPTYRYWPDTEEYPDTYTNYLGKHYSEYIEALRSTAAEYNLPVIDCYYGLGVNKLNVATMTSDGAHHSNVGRKLLGEFIGGHLISRQSSGKGGMDTAAVNALISSAIGAAIGGSY